MITVDGWTLPVNLSLSGVLFLVFLAAITGKIVSERQVKRLLDLKDQIITEKNETIATMKTQLHEATEVGVTLKKVLDSIPAVEKPERS